MTEPIRWGILATGFIAKQFAQALAVLDDAKLMAVGSRTREAAERFGDAHDVPRRHPSYEALAADPDVDIVYVATPHALHKDNSILCLRAGKAVLCEKPFTINRKEAEEVIAVARQSRRLLMEAMWTRFIPAVQQAVRWIAEGAIGEVRMVQASFGYRDHSPTLFDPHLGGGSLLDVGVYPITLAHLAFNNLPNRIQSLPTLGRNGVDEQAGILLGFEGGGLAILASAIQTRTPYEGHILGTEGRITLHGSFWNATQVSLTRGTAEPETRVFPHLANGYEHEAREAQACLREGRLESETMPHRTTLAIMDILDRIRAQWGLRYPMES